jgi:hypothetical protein
MMNEYDDHRRNSNSNKDRNDSEGIFIDRGGNPNPNPNPNKRMMNEYDDHRRNSNSNKDRNNSEGNFIDRGGKTVEVSYNRLPDASNATGWSSQEPGNRFSDGSNARGDGNSDDDDDDHNIRSYYDNKYNNYNDNHNNFDDENYPAVGNRSVLASCGDDSGDSDDNDDSGDNENQEHDTYSREGGGGIDYGYPPSMNNTIRSGNPDRISSNIHNKQDTDHRTVRMIVTNERTYERQTNERQERTLSHDNRYEIELHAFKNRITRVGGVLCSSKVKWPVEYPIILETLKLKYSNVSLNNIFKEHEHLGIKVSDSDNKYNKYVNYSLYEREERNNFHVTQRPPKNVPPKNVPPNVPQKNVPQKNVIPTSGYDRLNTALTITRATGIGGKRSCPLTWDLLEERYNKKNIPVKDENTGPSVEMLGGRTGNNNNNNNNGNNNNNNKATSERSEENQKRNACAADIAGQLSIINSRTSTIFSCPFDKKCKFLHLPVNRLTRNQKVDLVNALSSNEDLVEWFKYLIKYLENS